MNRNVGLRLTGICGIIEPIVVSSLVLLGISNSPWFSWTENALSDLGVQGIAAFFFNTGLVTGGILFMIFGTGLLNTFHQRKLVFFGSILIILDGFFLTAIGVFPETTGDLHFYVSVAYFALRSTSLMTLGVAIIKSQETKLGLFSVFMGISSALVWIPAWKGLAIPETLAYLSGAVWSITMSLRMIKQSSSG